MGDLTPITLLNAAFALERPEEVPSDKRLAIAKQLCDAAATLSAAQPVSAPVAWTAKQVTTVLHTFRAELNKNMELSHPSYSPGHDAMRVALRALAATCEREPIITPAARAALLWLLWHHQGGNSPVGQPIRAILGIGVDDPLTDEQIAQAKAFAASMSQLARRDVEAPTGDGVMVPREPKPGLLCGDVAISTDPRHARFVFVRHADGVNWTTCAEMTPMTWAMLQAMLDAQGDA